MYDKSLTIERALLLKTFSEKNLSQNCLLNISKIIKNTRKHKGQRMAENKAKELRLMIETCKSEHEVLEKLK